MYQTWCMVYDKPMWGEISYSSKLICTTIYVIFGTVTERFPEKSPKHKNILHYVYVIYIYKLMQCLALDFFRKRARWRSRILDFFPGFKDKGWRNFIFQSFQTRPSVRHFDDSRSGIFPPKTMCYRIQNTYWIFFDRLIRVSLIR